MADENEKLFREWMRQVDSELIKICGMGVDDLADHQYRDCFEDEMTPEEVAKDVMADNGYEFGEEFDGDDEYLDM